MSGSLLGPLLGGYLSELIGMRHVFLVTGAFLFLSFLIVFFFLHEEKSLCSRKKGTAEKSMDDGPCKTFNNKFICSNVYYSTCKYVDSTYYYVVRKAFGLPGTYHIEMLAGRMLRQD